MFFQLFALLTNYLPEWQGFSNYLPCWQVLPIICQGFSNYSGFFQLFALVATFFFALLAMFFFAHVFPIICQGFLLCWPIICLVGDVFPSICLVGRFSKYCWQGFFQSGALWAIRVGMFFFFFPWGQLFPNYSQTHPQSNLSDVFQEGRWLTQKPRKLRQNLPWGKNHIPLLQWAVLNLPQWASQPELSSSICPNGQVNQWVSPSLNCPNGPPIINPLVSTIPTSSYELKSTCSNEHRTPSPSECKRSRMSTQLPEGWIRRRRFQSDFEMEEEMLDYWWQFFPRLGRFTSTYGLESWRFLGRPPWSFYSSWIVNFCSRSSSGLMSTWTWSSIIATSKAAINSPDALDL